MMYIFYTLPIRLVLNYETQNLTCFFVHTITIALMVHILFFYFHTSVTLSCPSMNQNMMNLS